jgi:glutamate/aspartate transport system permease protein
MNWDWTIFVKDPGGKYSTYWSWLVSAWGWTLAVSILSLALALSIGSVVGIARTLHGQSLIVRLGNIWVEIFRNMPILVQVFIWYHVAPGIFPGLKSVPSFVLVVCALGFFTSSRVAEQLRAGIEALPAGQRYAGMALGFSTIQSYRYVILPMAYRLIIPSLTSEMMNLVKNSSVAFAVSVSELTLFAIQAQEETSRGVEIYLAVTACYVVSALAINRMMALVERKTRVPGFMTAGHH